MRFRDLKLGTKQQLGFGLILLIMAGVSIFTINRTADLREEVDVVTQTWLPSIITISDLTDLVSSLQIHQLQYIHAEDPEVRAREQAITVTLLDSIVTVLDIHRAHRDQLGPLYTVELQALDEAIDVSLANFIDDVATTLELDARGVDDASLNAQLRDVTVQYAAFKDELTAWVDANRRMAAAAAERSEMTFRAARTVTLLLFGFAIVLSIGLASLMVRGITVPVQRLVQAARQVAQGNLKVQIPVRSDDEVGKLGRSFNAMTRSLDSAHTKMEQQATRLLEQQADVQRANVELQEKSTSLALQKAETEQKNKDLEDALRRLQATQAQLVHQEKLASLGTLTAGIAHEIKNPLNFVNNFAALSLELKDELLDILAQYPERTVREVLPEVQELIDDLAFNVVKINEHGRRADDIVRSMLQHSRGQAGDRQPTDLNRLASEYLKLAYHGMRATHTGFNAAMDVDLDPAVGEVDVVPQEIGRVLLNLFNNAFYALNERAASEVDGYAPCLRLMTARAGDTVQIQVNDNGTGIPEEVRERIFEPFVTTKPTGEGTGLGLSLSYEVITQGHGGTLAVETAAGEGTTFTIGLPA